MTFTLDEATTSKNYTPAHLCPAVYKQSRIIKGITIHWWGSFGQRFGDVKRFLCTNTKPTSAHFVAEGNLVSCIVSPVDVAWHAGHPVGNATTIGIECRPEMSAEDFETVAQLIAFLRQNYGADLPLYEHNDWQNTQCPGQWGPLDRLNARARAIQAAGPVVPNTPGSVPVAPPKYVAPAQTATAGTSQCIVEKGDSLSLIGIQFGADWKEIAALNGIRAPYTLSVGQVLALPVTAITAATQCIVEPGDTLSRIAGQFKVDLQALVAANPSMGDPNLIHAGQVLNLPKAGAAPAPKPAAPAKPAPAKYRQCVVEKGDTLGAIAIQFGTSVDRLVKVNGLSNPNAIYPGQVLSF